MLVTFEGPEGAGKSTALAAVADALRSEGRSVVTTREPGAGDLGAQIRRWLLHTDELGPPEELFLFLADRAQHVRTVIRPALDQGAVVLCDRFADSTLAYQGHGRGHDLELLRRLNLLASEGLSPDRTLLLDLPIEVGRSRTTDRDRLEGESLEFHRRVREGFLAEARREPDRWTLVDATLPPEDVAAACLAAVLGDRRFL